MRPVICMILGLAIAITACSQGGRQEATFAHMEADTDYIVRMNSEPYEWGLPGVVVADWSDVDALVVDLRGVEDQACVGVVEASGTVEWGVIARFGAGETVIVPIDAKEAVFAASNCAGITLSAEPEQSD